MNMNLYGHDGQWLMVDCGIGFARDSGDTRIIAANPEFISTRRESLQGLLVTHAHEDHVGAVAHHWPLLRCPVYCTRFTAEILQRKLAEAGLAGRVPVHVMESGDRHTVGVFDIEWVDITHSTPESQALMLRTAVGNVFHTGDWKLDPAPVVGADYDAKRFQAFGDEGVLAMVCDSTNATVAGRSPSEGALYAGLLQAVLQAPKRVVVACFGSNVARLVTLVQTALEAGRYPGLLGRSLENYYRAARVAGLWPLEAELIQSSHLGYLPPEEVFAVATGSQGEAGAALSRLAAGSHPALELEPDDTVIFSSRVIPGNEKELERLYAKLRSQGVRIVVESRKTDGTEAEKRRVVNGGEEGGVEEGVVEETGIEESGAEERGTAPSAIDATEAAHIHASGHPAQDELVDMYQWVRPRIAVPVHGESRHLDAHAALAKSLGVPMQLNGRNGDLFMLAPQPGLKRRAVDTGRLEIQR
ncbi:MAG: ribonuclease J [Pseudomonadota bacterium]